MVTHELVAHMTDVMLYAYWPEDDRASTPGIVRVDLLQKDVTLVEPAARDTMLCTVRRSDGVHDLWKYFEPLRVSLLRRL